MLAVIKLMFGSMVILIEVGQLSHHKALAAEGANKQFG